MKEKKKKKKRERERREKEKKKVLRVIYEILCVIRDHYMSKEGITNKKEDNWVSFFF